MAGKIRLGRRERLEQLATAGDVVARMKLQHLEADRLLRGAIRRAARKWKGELGRVPIIPAGDPETEAVFFTLPTLREVHPTRNGG